MVSVIATGRLSPETIRYPARTFQRTPERMSEMATFQRARWGLSANALVLAGGSPRRFDTSCHRGCEDTRRWRTHSLEGSGGGRGEIRSGLTTEPNDYLKIGLLISRPPTLQGCLGVDDGVHPPGRIGCIHRSLYDSRRGCDSTRRRVPPPPLTRLRIHGIEIPIIVPNEHRLASHRR